MSPTDRAVSWSITGHALYPYEAWIEGQQWRLRLGDFPAEPLYTLLIDGKEAATLDDWPAKWKKTPADSLPRYYIVNDRPVRFIPTGDGGMDIEALNIRTGEFERAMEYLTKVMEPFADVDTVSEEELDRKSVV